MTNKQGYSLDRRIKNLAERIKSSVGDNPLVFLDTCAVIDFEKEVRRARLVDQRITNALFFDSFLSALHLPIYITEHIYREIEQHTRCRISGHPEISRGTFRMVGNMHSDYCDFLKNVQGSDFEFDKVRYDVYWAGKMAFSNSHKKGCRDLISVTDRELLSTALWARYTSIPMGEISEVKCITDSIIVSSDSHIIETSRVLNNPEFGYSSLRTVSSR